MNIFIVLGATAAFAGLPIVAQVADPAPISTVTTVAPTKVLTIIEENHSYAEMKAGMPYLFGLSKRYGYASDWTAISHPSLPNYLALTGGSTFGVTDDSPPSSNAWRVGTARSVFDQAINAGKTAKTYAESMPSNCRLTDSNPYAVRHNPWPYFSSSRLRCNTYDVPFSAFASAATHNKLPNVGVVIPNLCKDAHDCSLATADNFLKAILPRVLSSSNFTSGRLVVIVTADEDDRSSGNGNKVLTSVLSTRLTGKVVSTHLTHYSWTRYMAQVLRVSPLRAGRSAPNMKAAFGL